ncbi:23S rRNA methyltransferase, partial [Streptococcus agalactiae]
AYPNYLHEHVRYEVSLTAEVYRWLLEMTPLTWGADEGKRLELLAEPLPSITVAMSVLVGIK